MAALRTRLSVFGRRVAIIHLPSDEYRVLHCFRGNVAAVLTQAGGCHKLSMGRRSILSHVVVGIQGFVTLGQEEV